ncbi:MAG: V-type ATP synthase subunit D [Chlamydiales bacterium]|nr:V-type ATP synthase subunit D [Chlamydiales bacterium]
MTAIKLTKNELRSQQTRLTQFQRYLPTLQLKKAMLQFEVNQVEMEITILHEEFAESRLQVDAFAPLLLERLSCDVPYYAEVLHVNKRYENIAGVEIPLFEEVVFRPAEYFVVDTPVWTDQAIVLLQNFVTIREKISVTEEKKRALEKELREVSIRVNLFEKVLIPRSLENIKKIRIFLADQQLAAVAQAKVAKKKLSKRSA